MADAQVVNPRHSLKTHERKFCQIYGSFGFTNAAEAYRMVYYPDIENDLGFVPHPDMPPAREVSKRASALIKQQNVSLYLETLKESPTEAARNVLIDQIQFGSEQDRRQASKLVFEQEQALGARDATMLYSDIMSEIGTEVVIDLGEGYDCPNCGHQHEVAFPLALMMPGSGGSRPDEHTEALEKTVKALQARLEKQDEEIAALRERQ